MITHARKIDMYPASVPVVLHLSQYDDDFTIEFTLYSSVGTFTVESGTTAKIRGTKKDGNGYSANASINITQKKVTVTGNQQMTAIAGRNVYELVLTRNNKVLSTANFILDVEPAAMDANTVPSESVIQEIGEAVGAYLSEHPEMVYQVDDTLSVAGAAADAKKTGDEIADLKSDLNQITPLDVTLKISGKAADAKKVGDGLAENKSKIAEVQNEIIRTAGTIEEMECGLTEEVKTALLACFEHVAWIDADGQTYYDALETALNKKRTISSISAVFTQGSAVVYDTDELYSLKQYLTVTVAYDDTTTKEVSNYTLDGTLIAGTSTITVAYSKKTTTFNVTVTHQQKTLESITATLSSSAAMTTDNVLDDLRPYLTVRATYSDGSTQAVSNYTLNGSMNVGTNTITVTYGGKTTTFTVNVTEAQATLQSISANYSGKQLILSGESVEKLRNGLTVTAHYSDGTDTTVTNYTLSGTLAVGTNNIGVAYEGKGTTFNVSIPASHYLTTSDIESNYGVSLSIDSTGTPTHTSTGEVFFGILFKPSVKKIKCTITEWLDQSHFTLLVNKDGNNVYGIDPGTVNQYVPTERDKLTVTSGNTGYTKESDYTTTVIQDFYPVHDWPSVFIPRKDTEIVMELTNGKVTITDIQGNVICYVNATNANRLGYWGSFYLIGTYFTNIVVIGS